MRRWFEETRRSFPSRKSRTSSGSFLAERYSVVLTRRAEKELGKLDGKARSRIVTALGLLRDEPRPPTAKALTGHPGYLRVRVGDHRIVYVVEGDRLLVLVLTVGHRREIYRSLP
ncbi:type II toxin-antitoxin system RelE family toxin [Diaminobutyricibacter sp. McL0618]|uniref:type II toxin-antitoxin system RelE family toxin n=1 Tax=Leifsonia sp. McL0618 TaxID=3415677 RepID=UPI003CE6C38B